MLKSGIWYTQANHLLKMNRIKSIYSYAFQLTIATNTIQYLEYSYSRFSSWFYELTKPFYFAYLQLIHNIIEFSKVANCIKSQQRNTIYTLIITKYTFLSYFNKSDWRIKNLVTIFTSFLTFYLTSEEKNR